MFDISITLSNGKPPDDEPPGRCRNWNIPAKNLSKLSVFFKKSYASLLINTMALMIASSFNELIYLPYIFLNPSIHKISSILVILTIESKLKVFFFYVFGTTIYTYIHVIIQCTAKCCVYCETFIVILKYMLLQLVATMPFVSIILSTSSFSYIDNAC